MGNSPQHTHNDSILGNESIFPAEHNLSEHIKCKNPYEYEYQIGMCMSKSPISQNSTDQSERRNSKQLKADPEGIQQWKEFARKSRQIDSVSQQRLNENISNKFVLNKIDKMLYMCQQSDSKLFIQNVRDGPSMYYRWGCWKIMLQINNIYESGLYERLIEDLQKKPQDYEQIKKDIMRTFPQEKYFSHNTNGKSIGHEQLERVLGAISNYFPDLGYCQGMNFILGFLMMLSGGSEIDVFWAFVSLVRNPNFLLIGLYEDNMPLLIFLEFITNKMMKKHLRKAYDQLQKFEIPNLFWQTKWHLTLFLYTFPIEICIRIWDYILTEGIFGSVQILVPIMKRLSKAMEGLDDIDTMQFFQNLQKQEDNYLDCTSEYYLDMDEIIKEANTYKLSGKDIKKYAKEFLKKNENQTQNHYVKLYTCFEDKEKMKKAVQEMIEPKVYTHHSRQLTNSFEHQQSSQNSTQANTESFTPQNTGRSSEVQDSEEYGEIKLDLDLHKQYSKDLEAIQEVEESCIKRKSQQEQVSYYDSMYSQLTSAKQESQMRHKRRKKDRQQQKSEGTCGLFLC